MKKISVSAAALASAAFISSAAAAAPPALSPVAAGQIVKFNVLMPPQNIAGLKSQLAARGKNPSAPFLTPAQVYAQFGTAPALRAQVQAALTAAGLQVVKSHVISFEVSGTAAQISTFLRAPLYTIPTAVGGQRVITTGHAIMPPALAAAGVMTPTFANLPEHTTTSQRLATATPLGRNGPAGSYNYNELKQAYDYPSYQALTGAGVSIGIVMEQTALNSDVAAMFTHEFAHEASPPPVPTFATINIDGGGTGVGDEASLDVQQALGGAPGSNTTLLSMPDLSDNSIFDAYNYVIDSGAFDIISNSFGICESYYIPSYNNGYDYTATLAYQDYLYELISIEGTTILVSSGDEAGLQCPSNSFFAGNPNAKFVPSVSSPADDPNVTAVGGGNLITNYVPGQLDSSYVGEDAFGDPEVPYNPYYLPSYGLTANVSGGYWGAGGGLSQVFAQPDYQVGAPTGSSVVRTVPDIGMQVGGCPGSLAKKPCGTNRSSVITVIEGGRYGLIGTSVSSPEFAGALALGLQYARLSSGLPAARFGNFNYYLYSAAAAFTANPALGLFHPQQGGNDGYYTYGASAAPSYNYSYGNGSPDIRNLFGMTALPAAGTPRSPSNP